MTKATFTALLCCGALALASSSAFAAATCDEADLISLGGEATGFLATEGQTEWYLFTPPTCGLYSIEITYDSGTDMDLYIFPDCDPESDAIATSLNWGGTYDGVTMFASPDRVLFIAVNAWVPNGHFTLTVSSETSGSSFGSNVTSPFNEYFTNKDAPSWDLALYNTTGVVKEVLAFTVVEIGGQFWYMHPQTKDIQQYPLSQQYTLLACDANEFELLSFQAGFEVTSPLTITWYSAAMDLSNNVFSAISSVQTVHNPAE